MQRAAIPREVSGWTKNSAQPINIRECSSKKDRNQNRARNSWEKAALEGERSESVCDRVHGEFYAAVAEAFSGNSSGTSSLSARGTILNSTGRRESGSPSTWA